MRFDLMPTAMNTTAQLSFDRTNWIDLQEFSVSKSNDTHTVITWLQWVADLNLLLLIFY